MLIVHARSIYGALGVNGTRTVLRNGSRVVLDRFGCSVNTVLVTLQSQDLSGLEALVLSNQIVAFAVAIHFNVN